MENDNAVLLRDFSQAAAGYFGGIRIPATMVAGSSLGALFTFSHLSLSKKTYMEVVLIRAYHAFILSAFALALNTIVISTAATVTMMHGRFDPKAETAYQLLRREFDYEFCVTRWGFLVALLLFILGVTTRAVVQFDLLHLHRLYHLLALLCVMVAMVSSMISYINRTLFDWANLFEFTAHVIRLSYAKGFSEGHPLMIVSFVSATLAVLIMIKLTLFGGAAPAKAKEE